MQKISNEENRFCITPIYQHGTEKVRTKQIGSSATSTMSSINLHNYNKRMNWKISTLK